MRLRIFISSGIGLASGIFCWYLLNHFHQGAGDFRWAIFAARDLLERRNPYQRTLQLYPLPAALFGFPFVFLKSEVAGGVFYGVSSALLAFGLTKDGYHRLLIFLAYPYWAGILTAQWSPLIMASAFLPLALPAALAKPQIGLPVALTYPTRRGFLACAIIALLSLAVSPRWPLNWIAGLGQYQHFIPLLIFPGPLVALALLRWRERNARLLLFMALMPQRWFYDTLILWLIPKTRRSIIWTVFFSWGAGIWRWYHIPQNVFQVARWAICFIYLPMLVVVLGDPGPRD
ncbi:MAG: hypothetical protein ACRD2S_02240 [Terriglobales bacterium]